MFFKENGQYRCAVYLRLSRSDGDQQESNSIKNQRALLNDYLGKHPELHKVDEYVDDGYSGTNFERPDFKRMMQDIENRKINCIIVKDLSRFGRNYILLRSQKVSRKILTLLFGLLQRAGGQFKSCPRYKNGIYSIGSCESGNAGEKIHNLAVCRYSQPQILFNSPKPPSPRTCLIRKACIIQVQRKKRLVLEQSGSGDTER